MNIFTVPVVLGGGKMLFADGSAPGAYKLTRSRVSGSGVMLGHYESDSEIKFGETALNSPSKAEAARQELSDDDGESETPKARLPMKAVRFHEYGDPDVLRDEDVQVPVPGPGELRIRLASNSVHR